ncbi:hypothetical protein [Rhodomicrobium lacus]|uniref:hypothetical protein n=1 Tax=Rhodomicrobium lacus TaxID=2498452 RepID=UPI0026E41039|nr:hypothetical protein [Rhodomicrobium lacus]WKW51631.1 hypothetical protein QMO75_03870 [Rhodomicrobium lacus]
MRKILALAAFAALYSPAASAAPVAALAGIDTAAVTEATTLRQDVQYVYQAETRRVPVVVERDVVVLRPVRVRPVVVAAAPVAPIFAPVAEIIAPAPVPTRVAVVRAPRRVYAAAPVAVIPRPTAFVAAPVVSVGFFGGF